ncbi:MAG: segregation/condensation protein A [Nanoarchaeota archaeon]|nr:segregation/condensation protein A [Nanoarchaeota archaeon]
MLSNEQMIRLMVVEPSWEDVIVKIVAEEGMEPWSIDIVKLADAFSFYIQHTSKMRDDLRVPARFILIAAILLRMKSDILAEKERKILIPESPDRDRKDADLLRLLAGVPPLDPPIKRMPLKNVSLNELILSLRKAFDVQERRTARKERRRALVGDVLAEPDDINERIDRLLAHIKNIIAELENGRVEFSKLVADWKREKIVKTLMPMLHLAQEGKIGYEQDELFQEIMVELKKEKENNNDTENNENEKGRTEETKAGENENSEAKSENLKSAVREIVKRACDLKNRHTDEKDAPVNYACVFSQDKQEYDSLLEAAEKLGTVKEETPTGTLFQIRPLDTVSGKLRLLKIRLPDIARPERGDADFTVSNFSEFKKKYLPQKGFKLIKRENFEMIELMDGGFEARAYFSNPPIDEHLGRE